MTVEKKEEKKRSGEMAGTEVQKGNGNNEGRAIKVKIVPISSQMYLECHE